MNKAIPLLFIVAILISSCGQSTYSSQITDPTSIDNKSFQSASPTITLTEIPYSKSPVDSEREEYLEKFLLNMTEDERYDPSTHVLHKYINGIYAIVEGTNIYIITSKFPELNDDFLDLAMETLLIASMVCYVEKWEINHLELVYPNLQNWESKFFIDGSQNIIDVANNYDVISDVMDFTVSPTTAFEMTESANLQLSTVVSTNTPDLSNQSTITENYPECKDYSSGFVTCRIQKAYCTYYATDSGSPTFCNDSLYPTQTFTLLKWEEDWSSLDGKCLIVTGNISLFNGIPQIEATNLSQVQTCSNEEIALNLPKKQVSNISPTACGDYLSGSSFNTAIEKINFQMPNRWRVISDKKTYVSGSGSLFEVFVFKTSDSTIKGCVEEIQKNISAQKFPITYAEETDPSYTSGPILAVSNGTAENGVLYREIWAGFGYDVYIYIFNWTSYNENEISLTNNDVLLIMQSLILN